MEDHDPDTGALFVGPEWQRQLKEGVHRHDFALCPDTGIGLPEEEIVKGGCEWKVEYIPGFFWHPSSAPNWFYRMMMRLLLGWVWTRQ